MARFADAPFYLVVGGDGPGSPGGIGQQLSLMGISDDYLRTSEKCMERRKMPKDASQTDLFKNSFFTTVKNFYGVRSTVSMENEGGAVRGGGRFQIVKLGISLIFLPSPFSSAPRLPTPHGPGPARPAAPPYPSPRLVLLIFFFDGLAILNSEG